MKHLFAVLALCLLACPAMAEMRDPAPIVAEEPAEASDDGRHLIGVFDFVRPARTTCTGPNCPTGTAASPAPVVASSNCACGDSCPCGSAGTTATVRRSRPLANALERIRSWYPGKVSRAFFGR